MAKTKKYYIKFDNCEVDLVSKAIEISAEQYWTEMKNFDNVIEKTKNNENCGQAFKHSNAPVKKEHSTIYMDYCGFGTATVYLYREECDEGYAFVSKKHQRRTK